MTPDAAFPHLSHPMLPRESLVPGSPSSPAGDAPPAALAPLPTPAPPRIGTSPERVRAPWSSADTNGPSPMTTRRRAKSASLLQPMPATRGRARGRSRGAQKGGGFAADAMHRAARLPRAPGVSPPVHEEPLMHAWNHMQQQVCTMPYMSITSRTHKQAVVYNCSGTAQPHVCRTHTCMHCREDDAHACAHAFDFRHGVYAPVYGGTACGRTARCAAVEAHAAACGHC